MTSTSQRQKKGVTMQDIANRCGVSVMTVSLALRGKRRYVSQATMERVQAMAKEMGYDPSLYHAARRLRYSQSEEAPINYLVALFFPPHSLKLTYFNAVFTGVMDALYSERFALVTNFGDMSTPSDEEAQLPFVITRGDVDGAVVIQHVHEFSPVLNRLREEPHFRTRPIVSILEPMPTCSSVQADDWGGGYTAAAHLLELGHRRILQFFSEGSCYPHRQRLAGFRQACIDRGMDADQVLITCRWIKEQIADPETFMRGVFDQHPDLTAVLCTNDALAIEFYDLLQRIGRRVPQDISLVGFDDASGIQDEHGVNILTTVHVPLYELGQESARMLIRRINGEAPPDETLTLPTSLVVRGTTAPPHAS
jgi:LacI family transcriptional regulator